jgi:hypothetical protein
MKNLKLTLITLALSASALAATAPEDVDRIDNSREGNLKQLVLNHYMKTSKSPCQEGVELPKFEIVKVSSSSMNETKTIGTPYDYEANYLIVQKCLNGSTYAGAYSEPMKAVILKGSFRSKYNNKYGPAKMEDLKIEEVNNVDLFSKACSENSASNPTSQKGRQ